MVSFLTSSFIEYQPMEEYTPKPIIEANEFGDNLRKYWKDDAKFLVFASNPVDSEVNDHITKEIKAAFLLAGFSIGEIKVFDLRNVKKYQELHNCEEECAARSVLKEAMEWADVFFLAGGHAPTENAFMKKCGLKDCLHNENIFDGIFIGLSAGSVNAAEQVYLIPELPGESIDPQFIRDTDGLGITDINLVPHLQYEENVILDGRKLIDDIVSEDSFRRSIYLIPDGSYFMIRNGITEFFGEGYILEDGVKRPLHAGIIKADMHGVDRNNAQLLHKYIQRLDTIVSDYYDWVLEYDSENETIEFFHMSDFMLKNRIHPIHIDSFDELVDVFIQTLVVDEEKQPAKEQAQPSVILEEVERKGSYVRTVHLNAGEGIRGDKLCVDRIAGSKSKYLVTLTNVTMMLDHDTMTDEYSRDGFLVRAERMLKEPEYQNGYSLVYANIQGLKAVNELLGIHSGDMVIFMQRDVLVAELHPVLLARLESDHFVMITKTENLTKEALDIVCYQWYEEGSKRIPILIRCGIYHINDIQMNVQHMIDQAKLAENLISADHGIAYAVCDEKMRTDYVNKRLLITEIDSALQKKEFKTFYQPVVDAKTGEIVSAEALIRWIHSTKGMISPGQFIPVFEKEGLITKIDSFMIDSVLDFNINRMKNGQKVVPCAVNLSRVDFYDTNLLEIIRKKLNQQKNVQNMLKLEVTESAYAVLESDAISFLREMKKLGLSLMLDDFGSGMSSLSTLESFEFDIIKLDMGFIAKIGKSTKAEGIIKHTIGLSHDIGAKVVAEGVETEEQLKFLQEADCDMIQGYYFYKPMPEQDFAKLL